MTAVGNCEPRGDVSRADVDLPVGRRGSAALDRKTVAERLMLSGSARYELRR